LKQSDSKLLFREAFPDLIAFVGRNTVNDWAKNALEIATKNCLPIVESVNQAWNNEVKEHFESGSERAYRMPFFQILKNADPDSILREVGFFDCFKAGEYFECRTAILIEGNETKRGTVISSLAHNIWSDWAALALLPEDSNEFERQQGTFIEFIQTPLTEDGILDFANRFGFIGEYFTFRENADAYPITRKNTEYTFVIENGTTYDEGQFLSDWFHEITCMKDHFLLWKAILDDDLDFFVKYLKIETHLEIFISPTLSKTEYLIHGTHFRESNDLEYVAKKALESAFREFFSPNRINDTKPVLRLKKNKFHIIHESTSLLSSMWFEFAQMVTSNSAINMKKSEIKECAYCHRFFIVGERKNSKRSRIYCSTRCGRRKYEVSKQMETEAMLQAINQARGNLTD
jgi:hypothetical protein